MKGIDSGPVPLVTVVIPSKDHPELLVQTLDTVLAQEDVTVEVVIVDDGSTPPVTETLPHRLLRDPRVRIFRHESSKGAPAARNRGVAEATSEWIAFSDDDCVWHPRKLAIQMRALAESGLKAAYCQTVTHRLDGQSVVTGLPDAAGPAGREALLKRNFIAPYQVVLHRAAFDAVGGFDERLPRHQDWELWLRLTAHYSFVYVPDVLVENTMVAGGISSRPDKLIAATELVVEKVLSDPALSAPLQRDFLTACANELAFAGAGPEALGYFRRAFLASPSIRPAVLLSVLLLSGSRGYQALFRLRNRWQGGWVDRIVARFWG